jgi:rhodanese-related sulfurtransferase
MAKKKSTKRSSLNTRSGLSAMLRKPAVQFGMIALVAVVVYLIAVSGGGSSAAATTLPREVSVAKAYELYQQEDVFVLDVRQPEEWDEYHAPNTTLIPLGELQARINEVPKDKQVLVICRSGNRSQEGRNILLAAGYEATSMAGGLNEWRASGYPIE